MTGLAGIQLVAKRLNINAVWSLKITKQSSPNENKRKTVVSTCSKKHVLEEERHAIRFLFKAFQFQF